MNIFSRFLNLLTGGNSKVVNEKSQPNQSSRPTGFPPTFGVPIGSGESESDLIFDPSTQHYPRAYRRGDPKLPHDEMRRWHAARRRVMQHLLTMAATGPWSQNLVLRGSLTMKAFIGDAAREPGDIDWVIVPETIRMDQSATHQILDDIIKVISANSLLEEVVIETSDITQTDIWTYDRAPGRRLAFPWRCADLPPAVVQMDFVFEQKLHSPTREVKISLMEQDEVSLKSASCEESLAWKLLWLHSDIHPQGKDLYDAALLAENTTLSANLLKQVFQDADQLKHLGSARDFPFEVDPNARVDWENFVKECPWVSGSAGEWMSRLIHALRPTVIELRQN